ncbi:MAG: helix-hairpin-helix domain-containing protein, partial [Butyricicoccaceae bacterium]
CDLYVTLEPCPMCTGAIINARIRTVYYGADDVKAGSCGSLVNLFELGYNHKPDVVRGLMKEECSAVLSEFFQKLRERQKMQVRLRRQAARQSLLSIPGVGEDMQRHLNRLGIHTVDELKGQNPDELYERDCAEQGTAIDRCVLYVYRLAVYYAENEVREKEKLRWWYWKNHAYPESK